MLKKIVSLIFPPEILICTQFLDALRVNAIKPVPTQGGIKNNLLILSKSYAGRGLQPRPPLRGGNV
jgi:hypothetical protein